MTDNNNPISNKVNHSFTCFPVKNYIDYYKSQGIDVKTYLWYTQTIDEKVKCLEEAKAKIKASTSSTKAKIRLEGDRIFEHQPTRVVPSHLKVQSFTCYPVGDEIVLNVLCECPTHQLIVMDDDAFYKNPTYKAMFDYVDKEEELEE